MRSRTSPRELVVWAWYPADVPPGSRKADYLPAPWLEAIQEDNGALARLLVQNPGSVEPHAYEDVPLSGAQAAYPLLIMQPGLGPIAPYYTSLAEDLASHGYIVFASTPTYSSNVVVFPDGRVARVAPAATIPDNMTAEQAAAKLDKLVDVWAQDDRFVMDQVGKLNNSGPGGFFAGRLDLRSIGLFGHSFGGASAVETCSLDARLQGGSRPRRDGLRGREAARPLAAFALPVERLVLGRGHRAVHDRALPGCEGQDLPVQHPGHAAFQLLGLCRGKPAGVAPPGGPRLDRWAARPGDRLRVPRALFFDLELKGLPTDLLDRPSPAYPEVRIGPPAAP